MKTTIKSRQGGFAVVEIVLVVAILAAVAGVGYWVYQQRTSTETDTTSSQKVDPKQAAAQKAAIFAQSALDDEAKNSQKNADEVANQAVSDSTAASQIGDSSNATD